METKLQPPAPPAQIHDGNAGHLLILIFGAPSAPPLLAKNFIAAMLLFELLRARFEAAGQLCSPAGCSPAGCTGELNDCLMSFQVASVQKSKAITCAVLTGVKLLPFARLLYFDTREQILRPLYPETEQVIFFKDLYKIMEVIRSKNGNWEGPTGPANPAA